MKFHFWHRVGKYGPLLNYPVTLVPGSARCSSELCLSLTFLLSAPQCSPGNGQQKGTSRNSQVLPQMSHNHQLMLLYEFVGWSVQSSICR